MQGNNTYRPPAGRIVAADADDWDLEVPTMLAAMLKPAAVAPAAVPVREVRGDDRPTLMLPTVRAAPRFDVHGAFGATRPAPPQSSVAARPVSGARETAALVVGAALIVVAVLGIAAMTIAWATA